MIKQGFRLFGIASIAFGAAGCHALPPPCQPDANMAGDPLYVIGQDWHVELGIPVEDLGPLSYYRAVFPGAKALIFGYGKQTFITAPPNTWSEYILGPVPGPAVVQVMGLSVPPSAAYASEDVVTLYLPPERYAALTAHIWNDIEKNIKGQPELVSRGTYPDSMFYAAISQYNLLHTCNMWAVEAMQDAGLPVSHEDVIFSGQAMKQASVAAQIECRLPQRP